MERFNKSAKAAVILDKAKLYWLMKKRDRGFEALEFFKTSCEEGINVEADCLRLLWSSEKSSSSEKNSEDRSTVDAKPKLVFHTGWSKAGSSWLQTQFFPNLAALNYLGKTTFLFGDYNNNADISGQYPASNLEFKLFSEGLDVELFERALSLVCVDDQVNLFSHEGLSGRGEKLVAARLKELRGNYDVKVMLVIRRQADLLWSYYCYSIARGDIQENTHFNVDFFHEFIKTFNLDFNRFYEDYAELLGVGNLLLVPFEALWGDCHGLQAMAEFLEVSVPPRYYSQVNQVPSVNAVPSHFKQRMVECNPLLQQVREYIWEHFHGSNKLLDNKLKQFSLSQLGYCK